MLHIHGANAASTADVDSAHREYSSRKVSSPVDFSVHVEAFLHGHVHMGLGFAADAIGHPPATPLDPAGVPVALCLSQLGLQMGYNLLVPNLQDNECLLVRNKIRRLHSP